jgi:hypothetical protein
MNEQTVLEFYEICKQQKQGQQKPNPENKNLAKRKKELGELIKDYMLRSNVDAIKVGDSEAISISKKETPEAITPNDVLAAADKVLGDPKKAALILRALNECRPKKVSCTIRLIKAPKSLVSISVPARPTKRARTDNDLDGDSEEGDSGDDEDEEDEPDQ